MVEISLEENATDVAASAAMARQFDNDGYVVSRRMFSADQMRDFIAEI